ncbi:MAG: ABC transporter ATP-binding protein [Actinobacteria bacterium]|nr:MAG: ABC transporter ATP-binding protein [Actinomycetota bacterium]
MNLVETKDLTKYYGKERGIIDVNLNIKEGEIFGFIGPNGAGKSTTIRTLLTLIYPTSGSATIFGKDIIKYAPEIKEEIGYLPSEVFYYEKMRVIELLRYSASFYKRDKKETEKRIKELAELLNLELNKKVEDLSYGNKKKVGIIQGLLHRPKLIILDEPTGGLDPLMQKTFFNLVRQENKNGATVLFSSHILGEVQKLCDRVAIIKEGKIIKVEKVSTIIEHNYKRIKIETSDKIDSKYFAIDGISDYKAENKTISFLFKGNINVLTKKIVGLNLTNLWVEEPDLEEIFLHYYEKD